MRLPNAPLVEVVFELCWHVKLANMPMGNPSFGYDPAFHYFREKFEEAARHYGFQSVQRIPQTGPSVTGSIESRFRKSVDEPFPLLQIGPGIVACNMATDYEWEAFLELCEVLLILLEKSYPNSEVTPLAPNRLELRYVDHFGEELPNTDSISQFLDSQTNLGSAMNSVFDGLPLKGGDAGRLLIRKQADSLEGSWFEFEAVSSTAYNGGSGGVSLISKVFCEEPTEKIWNQGGSKAVMSWLNSAHDVTSPFFKRFVAEGLMSKFKG